MSPEIINLLIKSFGETCYMVAASTIISTLIGLPLGVSPFVPAMLAATIDNLQEVRT